MSRNPLMPGSSFATLARLASVSVLLVSLAGCGAIRDSRANPFNWFGGERSAPRTQAQVDAAVNPLIPARRASIFRSEQDDAYRGTLVGTVTELSVERAPGGAVIRATGVAVALGAFDPRLVEVETETPDVLRYELRALQPGSNRGQGTETARSVTVAVGISDQALAPVRVIEVVGAQNERSLRR